MVKAIVAAAALAAFGLVSTGAGAMPAAAIDGAAPAQLILVYGGCGPYGHRGPFGGCRPGGQWSGRGWGWRRCPIGYHLGPYGRVCWPN